MIKELKEHFFPIKYLLNQFMSWFGYVPKNETDSKISALQHALDLEKAKIKRPQFPTKVDDSISWHEHWAKECQHLNLRYSIFKIGINYPKRLQNLLAALSNLDLDAIQTYMKANQWTWGGDVTSTDGYYPEKNDLIETIFELARTGGSTGGFDMKIDGDEVTITFDGKKFVK